MASLKGVVVLSGRLAPDVWKALPPPKGVETGYYAGQYRWALWPGDLAMARGNREEDVAASVALLHRAPEAAMAVAIVVAQGHSQAKGTLMAQAIAQKLKDGTRVVVVHAGGNPGDVHACAGMLAVTISDLLLAVTISDLRKGKSE